MNSVSTSRVTPSTQFSSLGLRNAPVTNTRTACSDTAPTITSAAQWWICRNTRPERTSNDSRSTDWYALDMCWPFSGA